MNEADLCGLYAIVRVNYLPDFLPRFWFFGESLSEVGKWKMTPQLHEHKLKVLCSLLMVLTLQSKMSLGRIPSEARLEELLKRFPSLVKQPELIFELI